MCCRFFKAAISKDNLNYDLSLGMQKLMSNTDSSAIFSNSELIFFAWIEDKYTTQNP